MESPDRPTFAVVVEKNLPFIRRTLGRFGVGSCDLDDVEQEVLRAIERGLPGFDPARAPSVETALRGWIHGICERQAASHHRARRARAEVLCATDFLDYEQAHVPDTEARLLAKERSALLFALLASVEPLRRAVVVAYELEQHPMAQIARDHGIPLNTAWNRLRLGRADLRTAWRRRRAAELRGRVRHDTRGAKSDRPPS